MATILEAVRELADDQLVATAELGRIPAEADPEAQRSDSAGNSARHRGFSRPSATAPAR